MQKTELQKMLSGELYVAADPELKKMRDRARRLFSMFNNMPYSDNAAKGSLLSELFGSIGKNADIQAPFFCDYGSHIYAGDNLFMNFNCIILDCARVDIGHNVAMGPNVQIYTAYHPLNPDKRSEGPELASPVSIGDQVWLGGSVIICQGVSIGSRTAIGAGSVVTRDIPSDVFAAGNPCRVLKKL